MKKVKDVFGLPVRRGIDDSLVNNDGSYIGDFWTSEMANASGHAINHVDALAEALEKITSATGNMSMLDAVDESKAALAAYRGEK